MVGTPCPASCIFLTAAPAILRPARTVCHLSRNRFTTVHVVSSNQTASFLIKRFKEAGVRPDTRHGQNFLIDLNLQRLLASTAELGPDDVVLEVGTGTGALTARLAAKAAEVVTVEVDHELYQLASEELADLGNVTMLCQDALRNKNNLHPRILETVREKLDQAPGQRFKLAANLPYNIATPVIANLLSVEPPPVSMTVTIQKELADRIVSSPGTKDYGALSIWMQSQCDVRLVRVMTPEVFWPRPKVTSAIIQITLAPGRRDRIADRPFFHSFVRAMFFHRRKFLRNVVLSAFKNRLGKAEVDQILSGQGLDATTRAEQLDVQTMLALCEAVRAVVPD